MKKSTLIFAAVLAISFCAMVMNQLRHGGSADSGDSFATMGRMAAEQTALLLNNHGRIAILTGSGKRPGDPLKGPVLSSFRSALPHGISVISADADQPAIGLMGASFEQLLDFINKYPNADAIVAFVGLPAVSDAELQRLPAQRPKIACYYASVPAKSLFVNNIVQVAIGPSSSTRSEDAQRLTGRAWFNTQFVVVTAKSADSLPGSSAPKSPPVE
ncbi:MAG TPA: hypothetical protein VMP11_11260 [Verrucomicrobiae bacterium]|nr:hypothetical protein [Verrucomicrobiae bacterium]